MAGRASRASGGVPKCFTAFYFFMEKGLSDFPFLFFDLLMYKSMVFHDVSVLSHDFKTCLIFYQALSTGFQFFINLLEPWVCRPFVYIQIFCALISKNVRLQA